MQMHFANAIVANNKVQI